jgi:pimeloyl-ACP methyl ester carboxylesterase
MSLVSFLSSSSSPRLTPFTQRFVENSCRILLVVGLLILSSAGRLGAAESDEDDTKPQDLSLKTSDGLELKLTYYPSTLKKNKKDAVVVVLLHGWKGEHGDCTPLALFLQKLGHAVITPDLRGHGDSKYFVRPDGVKIELDANSLRREDFERMVEVDMEKVKDFIRQKNNAGELNMENLCIVGAEMGSSVAVRWAALDWSWPMLSTGKQGQDVKALVLISPDWNFKGMSILDGMQGPGRSNISYLILAGSKNNKVFQSAKKLNQALIPDHLDPPADEVEKRKTLFFEPLDTNLQGWKLVNEKSLNVAHRIAKFIELRIVKQPIPWEERKKI